MQEKIPQTSGTNSEHKHLEIQRFSTLNYNNYSITQSSVLGVN